MPAQPPVATIPAASLDTPAETAPDAPASGPDFPEAIDARGLYVVERAAWSLLWLGVLTAGVNAWGYWWSSALAAALAPLMIVLALAGMVATWLASTPRRRWLQMAALGGVELAIAVPQAIAIHTRAFYSTDSAAFDQLSARALLHGHNPYTVSLQAAAHLFSTAAHYWTYMVGGGHVAGTSYPAGSFLLQLPALALGVNHMTTDWTGLACWMACAALLFVLLARSLRWLGGLLALTPFFVGSFANGNTDALFMPLLLVAVWRWDRYGDPAERGPARWIGPVALGLACAVKQTPWFCVPFLAVGVAIEARRAGRPAARAVARYLGTVAAAFAVVNLPFAVWGPHAWAHGVLLPLIGGLVADGQGLVTLATHGVSGGVELGMLSAAGALALVAALVAFTLWYPMLKRGWLVLLPVVFFFSPRSLSSYIVDLVPVALLAAVSVRGAVGPERRVTRRGAALFAAPVAGVIACSALALSSHTLRIGVDAAQFNKAEHRLTAVTVTVTNLTGAVQRPHFMVDPGEGTSGYWRTPDGAPVVLAPHERATLTLRPPAKVTAPEPGAHWLVEAYTTSPGVLSTSPLVRWAPR